MNTEVGRLVIGVTADTSDARRAIENEIPKTGTTAGHKTSSTLSKALTAGAKVAGVGIAAVLGTALVKGFQRLSAIDQATHKLEGLGHSAKEVESIMDNALTSVKGTAFGLDEAATIAANAVAAGIKPGKELTRQLTLIADTATITGTSMIDLSDVFGDMYATGNATGETISRLQERGIPALKMLSDSMGMSMEETKEALKGGEVSVKDFTKAMEAGLGGAAKKGGETFIGSLKNVGAALSRFGASVLGPVFAAMPKFFGNITDAIDGVTPMAGKLGEAIGGLFADLMPFIQQGLAALPRILPTIIGAFTTLVGVLRDMIQVVADVVGWLVKNRDIIVPIAAVVLAMVGGWKAYNIVMAAVRTVTMVATAAQMALNGALLANPVGLIVAAIAGLVAGLVIAYKKVDWFRAIVDSAFRWIKDLTQAVWPTVQKIIQVAWEMISWWVEHYVKAVWAVISTVFDWIKKVVEVVWPGIRETIKIVWEAISWYVEHYVKIVWTVMQAAWDVIKAATRVAWNLIQTFIVNPIKTAWDVVSWVLDTTKKGMVIIWNDIKDKAQTAWQLIRDYIVDPIQRAKERVEEIIGNVRTWLSEAWTTIKNRASDAWNAVKTAILEPLGDLWEKFKSLLGINKDGQIIEGEGALGRLVKAFKSVVTAVRAAFGGITDAIKEPIIAAFKWINQNIIRRINDDVLSKFGGDLKIGYLPEKFARGGLASGPSSGYYAELHGTEFVMNERATRENLALLQAINSGQLGGGQLGALIQRGATPQTASAVQSAQSSGFNPVGWLKDLMVKGAGPIVKGLTGKAMTELRDMFGGSFGGEMVLSTVGTFFDNMVKWVDKQVMSTGALGQALYQWMMAIKGHSGYYHECLATIHRALDDLASQFGYTTGSLISSSPNPNAIIDTLGMDAFNTTKAPRGALVFWKFPGSYGHIAVSTGLDSFSINNWGGDTIDVVPNIGSSGYVGWLPPQRFVSKFDSGGWLQPGWTAAFNGTNRPEPILTADQWDALKKPSVTNNWHVETTVEPTEEATMKAWRRWEALQGV